MPSPKPTAGTASRPTQSRHDLPGRITTHPQELTEHSDGSITLDKRRAHACLSAIWEVETLAHLLAGLPDRDGIALAVRGISARLIQLSALVSDGLTNDAEPTIAIECAVYVKLRGQLEAD